MNKQDLTTLVAQKTGLTKKDTLATIEATFEAIGEVMISGEDVAIPQFGKFKVLSKSSRNGVDPRDGSKMIIPAHKVPKFDASSVLRKTIRES